MYRNVDDYHESRRRSNGRNADGDDYRASSSSRKSRSRWDERKPDGEKSGSRWDNDSYSKSKRQDEDRYKSRWNDKDDYDKSRTKRDDERNQHEPPSKAKSTEKRFRSRSRSPIKNNDRKYENFTHPMKEEKNLSASTTSGVSANCTLNDKQYVPARTRKTSNWSNSSDDDEQPPKSTKDTAYGSGISSKSSFYNEQSTSGQREIHDYTTQNVSFNQTGISSEINSHGSKFMSTTAPGISLKLGAPPTKPMPLPKVISVSVPVKSKKIAAVFNSDDEDEPEEMPAECRMRMKNVGRETKTSEGPNSFGKTKIGFCNLSHLAEKQLEGKPGANITRKKL